MLKDIEKELDNVELSIGNRMHVLDTDHDGIITQQELEHAFRLIKEQLGEMLGMLSLYGTRLSVLWASDIYTCTCNNNNPSSCPTYQ
jgi:hypothetical protein